MNFSKYTHSELLMDSFNRNKFSNQYDQPNKFYKIGPYILDKVIGKGNFSVVKLAIHTPTQMQVAIKILHKSKMSKETLEKTYREVYIMKQLSHPHIVRLYQVIDSSEWLFIVMEYALNGELFDHLAHIGRLGEKDARHKFRQILDAVDYCHKMNIVHRDLKAENLLLDKFHNIKLADFGFGSFYENSFLLSTWCGSPPYAAPELFKGEPYVGPKADIWSLGVILYAMVCGTLPFDEPANIVKLREQVLSGWVRFPYFLSYECEHLIRMILNRSPMKRPTIATIKSHKWMQPTFENSLFIMERSRKSDKEFCDLPSQNYSSQRCNTLGGDSGFDEPINEYHNTNPSHVLPVPKVDFKEYEFNEHSLQIMERCGFNRADICEELISKKYGSHTATYLLLGERLRTYRQSYPPVNQDTNNNDNIFVPPAKIKTGFSYPMRFTPEYSIVKPHSRDLLENINSDFKRIPILECDYVPQIDRNSPYENMKEGSQLEINGNKSTNSDHDILINPSIKPYSSDLLSSELMGNDDKDSKYSASVTVDVFIPSDPAQDRYVVNENCQMIPKIRSSNSPDYVLSYPRRVLVSRPSSNFTSPPCLVLESPRPFNGCQLPNGVSRDNKLIGNISPYSNMCPLQPNTAFKAPLLYQYSSANHNRKSLLAHHHQPMLSMKPIMVADQSTNASPRINNCSYQVISNDIPMRNPKDYVYQSPQQRNKGPDPHILYDNDVNVARIQDDYIPVGLELKNCNFNNSSSTIDKLENDFSALQLVNSYNSPSMVRASQYQHRNDAIQSFQTPPLNNLVRYSLSDNQRSLIPQQDKPFQRIQAFNVIPITSLAPTADLDYTTFS